MRGPAVLRAVSVLTCAYVGLGLSIAAHAQTPPPGQGKYTVTETALAEAQERAKALHAGPAAWVEEYWDVMPDKVDEFVKTYRAEVYSLARKVPGYRGYTVLTNIPDAQHPKRPPAMPYVPKMEGLLLKKTETPFAPLYWDRYEALKPSR